MVMVAQQWECTQCHQTAQLQISKVLIFTLCVFYQRNKQTKIPPHPKSPTAREGRIG